MDQISPPFRIALLALLAVCALWFTVLKPKDPAATAPPPTAPGVTGLANDVNAAKGAAATSDAANAKVQDATGGTTAPTAKPTATPKKAEATGARAAGAGKNGGIAPAAKTKAATSADPAAPLLSRLDRKHAVVLLFWNRKGSDDRAVRRAVSAVNRRHGRVVVRAVPVSAVGRYEAITAGVQVMQSPTVLVIGADHKAKAIAGFTTTAELDRAAGDAIAAAAAAK